MKFLLHTDLTPKGHQPAAIDALVKGVLSGKKHQVMLGVTGSGKTFTMANVIERVQKPTLVIAPNKTLAAQLYNEFKSFFPENAVEFFVSYYDYYQPEAYLPVTDTYIQKDASINEMIDKMRHSATRSVLSRRDVLVVASVSCIFGLGAPEDYLAMRVQIQAGEELSREHFMSDLVSMQYHRNDMDFYRGVFRVRGDRVEIFPSYEDNQAIRVDFFGDTVESISEIDPLTGNKIKALSDVCIFPASHYVTQKRTRKRIFDAIQQELKERVDFFLKNNQLIEAQRIEERTNFDLEMIHEIGYCNGIENYARHLTGRKAGEPPPTLLDYFPDDFLMFIDESHIAVPQLRGMYHGDRSRKETLVEYGFRLPSALDNRPLRFDEFENRVSQVIYVSATPGEYEMAMSQGAVVEQIVRPTGLLDPVIEIHDAKHQVDDLLEEIRKRVQQNERILVTTLTKRMAEDLSDYFSDFGIRVRYLHSDIKTLERIEIIRDLRLGEFDVLIGINLLREGLDIPEVSLVAILDADKEGFLRSTRSLIQTCGRAARNVNGKVIMYADMMTDSMRQAVEETTRRRKIQEAFNKLHQITPSTIEKKIETAFIPVPYSQPEINHHFIEETRPLHPTEDNLDKLIASLEKEMRQASKSLEFEKAAVIRDQINALKQLWVFDFTPAPKSWKASK